MDLFSANQKLGVKKGEPIPGTLRFWLSAHLFGL